MSKAKRKRGRPWGANGLKTAYERKEGCYIRCTEGFHRVIDEMIERKLFASKSDVLHEALQILAARKIPDFSWKDKIQ